MKVMKITRLFQPGRIGKMELKNRLVMAPMASGSHDSEGFVREKTADYYVERAKGGVGLIIAQSSQAVPFGRAPGRAGAWDDKYIPFLAMVAESVHKYDTKIAWQVAYHGKLFLQWLDRVPNPSETRVLAPSAIPWVRMGMAPQAASREDIEILIEEWSEAARRIKDAGFDAVEIHGAHGYAITQWLSPRDNQRDDEYGGTPENRARFACQLISRTRDKVGWDFPIIFRFSGSDFMPGGITLEQSMLQAPLFVKAGADALHVSACEEESTQWQFLSYLFPDGAIVHLAESIKKTVNVPVITVGKIWNPIFAEQILEQGKADFIAMGRALLADPELPNKARRGHFADIRRCIYCNNCTDMSLKGKVGSDLVCTVNPTLLRETEFVMQPAISPKKVIVVGGGVAGMEAARRLAERGHYVTLYEKESNLGGQFRLAAQQPHKEAYVGFINYQINGLKKVGVEIFLNTEMTAGELKRKKPDVIVVATGARPRVPDIPGVNEGNVVQANDVIARKSKVGKRVLIIGGRLIGMEVALQLAERNKRVMLTTRHLLGGSGARPERNLYRELRNRLFDRVVQIFENSPVVEIRQGGVYVAFHNDLVFLESDTVVLAVGAEPDNKLFKELKEAEYPVYAVGDCIEARNALLAIREGAVLGSKL